MFYYRWSGEYFVSRTNNMLYELDTVEYIISVEVSSKKYIEMAQNHINWLQNYNTDYAHQKNILYGWAKCLKLQIIGKQTREVQLYVEIIQTDAS